MGRRLVVALAICAVLPVVLYAVATVHETAVDRARELESRLAQSSHAEAFGIRSRLGAAEAIVQALTVRDVDQDGAALRQQIVNSRAFKSVVVMDRDGVLPGGDAALRPTPAQQRALDAGQTVLLPVAMEDQFPAIFLTRLTNTAGTGRLACFEIAPDWLWETRAGDRVESQLVIVNSHGQVLQSGRPVSTDVAQMIARTLSAKAASSAGRLPMQRFITWQGEGKAWRGSLTEVTLAHERITALPWAVVVFDREPAVLSGNDTLWRLLPPVLLLGLLTACLAASLLARRYVPALRQLARSIPALQAHVFERITVPGVADEPRHLVNTFNRSVSRLEAQFHALETLGEIDKLLLGSAELEHVLDTILSRMQSVTRCHSVAITLCDADAPGHARTFTSATDVAGLPVSRVLLDDGMIETLLNSSEGLTVTRCEEQRHSFLKAMQEAGSQFFWVWPVIAEGRVNAILAVGYREAPVVDPQIARYGSQFAERLSTALSKSARDERLYRQAHFDPLTALPNRLLFRDRLAQELASSTAGLSRGALLYVDLDHFKRVNDSVGHNAGDQLLTIIAQRLRSAVKDGDTVSRLGGDEFAVILRNVADPDAARTVADRIIESVQLPVNIAGRDHYVCASIGVTLFPDDSGSLDDLMRNADMAMYRAKDMGRGRAIFFDVNMTLKPMAPTESGLHRALRRREFSLFYQPQYSIADGTLQGVEALLRWQPPRESMRFPAEFVPAAEETGLIVDLGGWVLDAACAQMAAWRDRKIAPPRLSLNVSAHQLRHADFPRQLRRALDKYGLPPSLLELELTESTFTDELASPGLERLAQLGVNLALDDFGAARSSQELLRQYPIGSVKIDRSFLEDVPRSRASVTLVEAMLSTARSLGKRVIAEGVESIEQLEFLRERRCDVAQGFFLARPLNEPALTALLQARAGVIEDSGDVRAAG